MKSVKVAVLGGLLAAITTASGCGAIVNEHDHKDEATPAAVSAAPVASVPEQPKAFEGYVGGAFEVSVDGVSYADMEDFYTQEQARLPEKVKQAGYDASWTVTFAAEVGFSDLWRNMTVYLSPVDKFGYQGETRVQDSGHFAIMVPVSGFDHSYKARATKRIGVVLTRGDARREICYNFSALEKDVPFARDGLPIVLDAFVSQITAYACDVAASGGVTVPAGQGPEMLRLGQTKSDATRILGVKGLSAESSTAWCWAYRPAADSPCAEARPTTDGSPSCDCRVSFDAHGTITGLDGVSKSYTGT